MKSRAHRYRYVRHVAMSCFPDGRSAAPPTLSYATPQSWTYGVAITTLSPTTTGATSFAVQSGTLPTGVSLNTTTGDITGTPTVAKVAANVVIRATGPGGTADATINIAVPSPLYTSLREYWNLDEASGVGVGAHAGLNLTDNNTVTSQATGGPDGGRCRQFTRANAEYLSRSDSVLVPTSPFTVVVFFRADSLPDFMSLLRKNGSANDWYLSISATKKLAFAIWNTSAAASEVVHGTTLTVDSAWHMALACYDGTDLRVSLDNGADATTPMVGTPRNAGDAFHISDGGDATYFDGRLAYAMFTQKVLTAAERTWLWNSGAGRAYAALATYDGG